MLTVLTQSLGEHTHFVETHIISKTHCVGKFAMLAHSQNGQINFVNNIRRWMHLYCGHIKSVDILIV